MTKILAKIYFLHNAKPYKASDAIENITLSCQPGALPNTGDIVKLAGITHPEGSFVVVDRVFEAHHDSLDDITSVLGIEGKN